MRKAAILVLLVCLGSFAWAQSDQDQDKDAARPNKSAQQKADKDSASSNMTELQSATEIIEHISSAAPDKGIPQTVLDGAKCVAVIPQLIKGAFVLGGEHGTGVATCRTGGAGAAWSSPAPFSVSGISWGPQIGGKSTDLVMFIMNEQGMKDLMSGHFKVGGDVSAAAGPVGRSGSAEAGWKAAILTYSSSKGAFIGASINGATLQEDKRATQAWYGREIPMQDILSGKVRTPNAQARAFVNAVQNAKESAQVR